MCFLSGPFPIKQLIRAESRETSMLYVILTIVQMSLQLPVCFISHSIHQLRDLVADTMMLSVTLEEIRVEDLDLAQDCQGPLTVSCEHGDNPSVSISAEEIFI